MGSQEERHQCPGSAPSGQGRAPGPAAGPRCPDVPRVPSGGAPGLFLSREGGARSSRPRWKVSPDGRQPALGTGFKGLLLGSQL